MDPEVTCVSEATGKADGLGPLIGGMVFDISVGMARRLMMKDPKLQGGIVILDEIAEKGIPFEMAVGRNGRVWVDSKSVSNTLVVGRALVETDSEDLDIEGQKKLVKKLIKAL
jgi:exosome complex component RRP40